MGLKSEQEGNEESWLHTHCLWECKWCSHLEKSVALHKKLKSYYQRTW